MSSIAFRRSRRGNIRFMPLFALFLTFGSGMLLYRHFFHRSGEEATELIPADACMIATLDLNPAPDQVPLFTRIAHAMADEKIANPVEKAASSSTNGSSFFDEIRPQLQFSYAAAAWAAKAPKSADDLNYVLLATVKDPAQVGVISANHGDKEEQDGLTYYRIRNEKFCVSVLRDYLLVADSPASLLRIQAVAQGKNPSISSVDSYQEARAHLPAESNLMVFGNMTEAAKSAEQRLSFVQKYTSQYKVAGWSIMAVTLRDRGIETIFKYPYAENNPCAKVMSETAPIDPELYKRLPGSAYGLLIFSQPGRLYQVAEAAPAPGSDEQKTFQQGVADFEKETGLCIPQDLIPGLIGHVVLGVYPTSDTRAIPDGLIMLDDANGADPAAMVDKIKAAIARSSEESHSTAPTFKRTERNGAIIWTLDDESERALRQSAGIRDAQDSEAVHIGIDGVNVHSGGADVDVSPDSVQVHGGGSDVNIGSHGIDVHGGNIGVHIGADGIQIGPSSQSKREMERKKEEKQLIFATVGKTVLIASSEKMLDRAIASYTNKTESLADDPGYIPLLKQIPQGTQNLLLVDVPGVMERMRPMLRSLEDNFQGVKVDDIVGFCGPRGTGLIAAQGYDGKMFSASLFVPVDYTNAIHTFSAASRAVKQNLSSISSQQDTDKEEADKEDTDKTDVDDKADVNREDTVKDQEADKDTKPDREKTDE